MSYYVYAYLREDGSPYYIGKGKGNRMNDKNYHNVNLPSKDRRIILHDNLSEDRSFELEKELIQKYGRKIDGSGILRNLTEGGLGGDTSQTPNYLKALQKRKDEGRYVAWNKGISTPRTKESIEKQRKTMTGKKRGPYKNYRYDKYNAVEFRGKKYPSMSSAQKDTGASYYTVKKYGKPIQLPQIPGPDS